MIRRPIFNTRQMNRRMNRRYKHRFIRRLRVWLQFWSRVCAQASDDPTPWPSVHSTVAFKFNRDAPKLLLQHRMNRRLDGIFIGSSDGVFQIIQYCPECGAFSTGWSDGASVYSVGALSGFLGSTAILGAVRHRMIRRSAGGNHRFIRRYYFFRRLFQWLSSFARPINKPPCLSRAAFATLKIYCSLGEKESVFLPIGISLPLHWGVLSSWARVLRCIHGLAECSGQVKVCGLVTLGVW
jgi:hypothetical protein